MPNYLLQDNGQVYPWTPTLAKRPDMRPIDDDEAHSIEAGNAPRPVVNGHDHVFEDRPAVQEPGVEVDGPGPAPESPEGGTLEVSANEQVYLSTCAMIDQLTDIDDLVELAGEYDFTLDKGNDVDKARVLVKVALARALRVTLEAPAKAAVANETKSKLAAKAPAKQPAKRAAKK